jgi:hypothetical protein
MLTAIPTEPAQAEPREKPPATTAMNPWKADDALRWLLVQQYQAVQRWQAAEAAAAEPRRPTPPRGESASDPRPEPPAVEEQVAPAGGGWTENWYGVAGCESGGDWSYNGPSGFDGGLQFSPSTWTNYGGGEFAPYAWGASPEQQMTIAERVKAGQGMGAWPHCRIYG